MMGAATDSMRPSLVISSFFLFFVDQLSDYGTLVTEGLLLDLQTDCLQGFRFNRKVSKTFSGRLKSSAEKYHLPTETKKSIFLILALKVSSEPHHSLSSSVNVL